MHAGPAERRGGHLGDEQPSVGTLDDEIPDGSGIAPDGRVDGRQQFFDVEFGRAWLVVDEHRQAWALVRGARIDARPVDHPAEQLPTVSTPAEELRDLVGVHPQAGQDADRVD